MLFVFLPFSHPVLTLHASNTLQIYSLGNRETMQALASCQPYDQRTQHCMSLVSDEFTSSLVQYLLWILKSVFRCGKLEPESLCHKILSLSPSEAAAEIFFFFLGQVGEAMSPSPLYPAFDFS